MDSTVVLQQNDIITKISGEKAMPILHYVPESPPCRMVLFMGRLLNIEYDLRFVDVTNGDNLTPEYLKMNPLHTMPTFVDNGLVLYESRAIIAYLAAAYGKDDTLYPKDIRLRALVDQRLQFDLGTLYPRYTDFANPVIYGGAPVDEVKKEKIIAGLDFLELMLKGHTWAATKHFTIADLSLTITVAQIELIKIELEPFPRVRNWLARCKDHLSQYGYDNIQAAGVDLAGNFLKNAAAFNQ